MGNLKIELPGRGFAFRDTGTHDSLLDAGASMETNKNRQGLKIPCFEEFAYRMGIIAEPRMRKLAAPMREDGYGQYLLQVLKGSM